MFIETGLQLSTLCLKIEKDFMRMRHHFFDNMGFMRSLTHFLCAVNQPMLANDA